MDEVVLAQVLDGVRPNDDVETGVVDAEVRVVPLSLGQLRHRVDEDHERHEVRAVETPPEFACLMELPAGGLREQGPGLLSGEPGDAALARKAASLVQVAQEASAAFSITALSSPLACISLTMSQPPMNSPFT